MLYTLRNLKQVLNHRFILKKVHSVIKNDQEHLLKSYIEMNPRENEKTDFVKFFLVHE